MEGEQAGGKRSKWMVHVKKTIKAHKGVPLAKILKMAGKTYKGGAEEPMKAGALSPLPLSGGRRKTRKGKGKGKKGTRKH